MLTLLLAGGGCGDDGAGSSGTPRAGSAPHVGLAEAQSYLERGPLDLVRQALGDAPSSIITELDPRPATTRRLEARNSREFDLLVYATPAEARASWESILDTAVIDEGGTAMRALNLVALFPAPADDAVYAQVKRKLRRLATACRSQDGPAELRALCFGEEGAVPPPGAGVAADEVAPLEAPVVVGDVRYRPIVARLLNPRIKPDRELVGGRTPDDGAVFFAVVIEACNASGARVRTTDRLALVSAFGAEEEPVGLPADNPFAYRARTLGESDCVPEPGSVAERTLGGRLVLFEIPRKRLDERPLALRIVSRDGNERATVGLDV